MTASTAKTTIIDKLQDVLPDLFIAAGLDDFEEYIDEQPGPTEKRVLGIYIAEENDTTEFHTLILILQAQLYKKLDWKQEYHSVMMAAIRTNITASLIGFIVRERITADLYPVERSGSSFNFYEIEFSEPLDDCQDDS